jgi:hypothetical protein
MIDEELVPGPAPVRDAVWVKTWSEGVALLDRNPWAQLVPLEVRVEFREAVLVEVTRRLLAGPPERSQRQMERWLVVFGVNDGA